MEVFVDGFVSCKNIRQLWILANNYKWWLFLKFITERQNLSAKCETKRPLCENNVMPWDFGRFSRKYLLSVKKQRFSQKCLFSKNFREILSFHQKFIENKRTQEQRRAANRKFSCFGKNICENFRETGRVRWFPRNRNFVIIYKIYYIREKSFFVSNLGATPMKCRRLLIHHSLYIR